MNLSQFDDLDVKILSSVLNKQVVRWDETWGSAAWRRENKVTTASKFWQDQKMTRDRAAKLSRMFREEEKRRGGQS